MPRHRRAEVRKWGSLSKHRVKRAETGRVDILKQNWVWLLWNDGCYYKNQTIRVISAFA